MAWNEPTGDNNKDKDPWRDKNKQAGPPDLDEMLKKLQQKLNGLFGKRGNSSRFNQTKNTGNGSSIAISLVLIVLLILWLLSGIFIVGPAERAVVLRFGKYVDTVGPGPHWIARFIESKEVVNVEKVSNFSYTAEMLNKDENIVSVSVAVQYRIDNLRDFLFNVVNPLESLQQATASSLRQVIGHTTLDEILTRGREKVRSEVSALLKEVLANYKTGITITDVTMLPAKAPEEVKSAFDDAIKAQEDEQRYINQAQAYTATVEPIARGKAERILQEAKAYKEKTILQAKGEVSQFLAMLTQYQLAPQITRERLYIDAIQSVLSQSSKIIVDTKEGNNVLYLPLDRMMQRSAKVHVEPEGHDANGTATPSVTAAENASTSSTTTNQTSAQDGARGMESTRGRENYIGREGY